MQTVLFKETADWFERERGIEEATLRVFGIRQEQDGTIVYPFASTEKYRTVKDWVPTRDWSWPKGTQVQLYESPDGGGSVAYLVEGESDTMRLWQELRNSGDPSKVFGLSGVKSWRDEWRDKFTNFERVYVILDNDPDYSVRSDVDREWKKIRNTLGRVARRIELPEGVKDLCEFFQSHSIKGFEIIRGSLGSASNYAPLDLFTKPTPTDWMVNGLIAQGDVSLLQGHSGLGKSYVSLSLALAIAGGLPYWLGRKVQNHGRVLYVDQENPENEIYERLRKLGATDEAKKNIRYLHFQGIRLDRNSDTFFDEVYDFSPKLVIIDSLTRSHAEDENSAGAMAKLFNESVLPIARETGATVLIIHHTAKLETSPAKRARGSSDLTAVLDSGLDLSHDKHGNLRLVVYKARRIKDGTSITFRIEDTPEGGVKLVQRTVNY